ncbi:hypothetical protein K3495_g6739 [Podosphaera aphanis]|nr:hypothetical protein K3495_g6739 [Podosphaera aphanis]
MEVKENHSEEDEKDNSNSNSCSSLPSLDLEKHPVKARSILRACKEKDIKALRKLVLSEDGLISDCFRREAWPLLLGMSEDEGGDQINTNWRHLPIHPDEDQVKLDVNRSFIYYPNDASASDLKQNKQELFDLITEVLRRLPYLSYFQGFHDICQVFMLVLSPKVRVPLVCRMSVLRIRDFMLPTFAHAIKQLQLIPSILYEVNPKLWRHLSTTQPFFALSGMLTMYAHDIQEYGQIARIFDVLIAREAVFSLYMFAQIILQRADELFLTPTDEPEILQSILSKLPKSLDIEILIQNTVSLFERHPPEELKAWHTISRNSVLKTTRWPDEAVKQSLEMGHKYFKDQVIEIQWSERRDQIQKTLWSYRRPVAGIGLSLLVGIFSIWLSKSFPTPDLFGEQWRSLARHSL